MTDNNVIKLRAWDERNKKMFTEVQFISSGDSSSDWICFTSKEQPYDLDGQNIIFRNPYCRPQIHLMRFTGAVYEGSTREIFEGDIARYYQRVGVITYDPERMMFLLKSTDGHLVDFAIRVNLKKLQYIGNIFTEPHLNK